MPLCKTVSILADELEQQLCGLNMNHKNMLTIMKEMPSYLVIGNLARWEEDYRSAIPDDEDESSQNYKAIDLIYELAGFNLFAAFQETETKRIYNFVVSELAKSKITVSGDLDVSQW